MDHRVSSHQPALPPTGYDGIPRVHDTGGDRSYAVLLLLHLQAVSRDKHCATSTAMVQTLWMICGVLRRSKPTKALVRYWPSPMKVAHIPFRSSAECWRSLHFRGTVLW